MAIRSQLIAVANWNPAEGWQTYSGDFNGDGLLDIAGFRTTGPNAGRWQLGLSNGTTIVTTNSLRWSSSAGWRDFQVGDYNGDGNDDVIARTATGQWWAVTGNGTGFDSSYFSRWSGTGWLGIVTGDFNNDGRDDIAGLHESGQWWTGFSNGNRFLTNFTGQWSSTAGWQNVHVGDFNGDGRDDVVAQTNTGQWYYGTSTGAFVGGLPESRRLQLFAGSRWSITAGFGEALIGDFDGDGSDDIAGRNAAGNWYIQQFHNNNGTSSYWGRWATDRSWTALLGDFNGDGRDDIAGVDDRGNLYASISQADRFVQQNYATSLTTNPTYIAAGRVK